MSHFIFATGIENSYPTIEWQGKTIRQDELAKTKHYDCWRDDFRLVKDLGIGYLRYGPPYFSTHTGRGKYDWALRTKPLPRCENYRLNRSWIFAISACLTGSAAFRTPTGLTCS